MVEQSMNPQLASSSAPAWEQFQKDAASLFQLAGYDVETNVLLGHKKVDVRISERRLGKAIHIAVECKYWKRSLTQEDVTKIYANYLPLIAEHVDEILILTEAGLSESASSMVHQSPHLRHLTYSELLSNLFDFRHYLRTLVDQFYEEGLDRYYVPLRTTEDEDLTEYVEAWVADSTIRPLAILGSYGLGKTTFARAFSHKHAKAALEDVSRRIPILIRLGEIANEQSLEGLLGKLFTTGTFVRNYNFSTFMELNKIGRFLIFFDGFDEMKQTLSWEEFRYNLKEINRLVLGRGKVVILGRPTAFLNDDEYKFALHGIRKAPIGERRDADWPDYIERTIAPFDEGQIRRFLPTYVRYLVDVTDSDRQRTALSACLDYDAKLLLGNRIGDIAKRPVQLKMITEILPDYHGDIDELTVHTLYDYFIDYVIERESYKQSRRRFTTLQRRAFAREVALWLWTSRERSVSEHTIPEEIIKEFRGPNEPLESVVRDLVAASLLDRRLGGRLHFPHRSFQEFLVAESIALGAKTRILSLETVVPALTPQVLEFLEGFAADNRVAAGLCAAVQSAGRTLPLNLLKMIARINANTNHFAERSKWRLQVIAIAVASDVESERVLLEEMKVSPNLGGQLFAALVAAGKGRDAKAKQVTKLLGIAIDRIRDAVVVELRELRGRKRPGHVTDSSHMALLRALSFTRQDKVILTGLYKVLRAQGHCFVADWDADIFDFGRAGLPVRVPEWRPHLGKEISALLASFEDRSVGQAPRR